MLYDIVRPGNINITHPFHPGKDKNVQIRSLLQRTLKKTVTFTGVGLHSGNPVTLKIKPASANSGFVFIRVDVEENNVIPAQWDTVVDTSMCTKIANSEGVSVSTIEHLMAAFRAMNIHNALIEINGPEVPIMDGSSINFIQGFQKAGTKSLMVPVPRIQVLKPIQVIQGKGQAWLLPADESRISIYFDGCGRFDHPWTFDYRPEQEDFTHLLSKARTFGFFEDAERLQKMGLARGASLDNTIVIKDKGIMNHDGLRYEDELVRHKVLDAYGDLFLAGVHLVGHFQGHNSGHGLNNLVLRALFEDEDAWTYI